MWEKTLKQRFALIGIVLLIAIYLVYPPSQKLRGGLDIEGGVSLIYEIEEEEGEDNPYLAEQMKRLLQRRVDPKGVYGLTWRVLGRNRLEIQMPLPPEENKQLKAEFLAAQEALLASNIRRSELERAVRLTGAERDEALRALARGSAEREKLLREAAAAYDEYQRALAAERQAAAQQPAPATGAATGPASAAAESQPASRPSAAELRRAVRDAEEAWYDAVDAVLDTNFDIRRFQDILEMEPGNPRREGSLKDLYARYPELKDQIETVVAKHNAWREKRVALEGPADLQRLLRGAGVLEFRILAEPSPENVTKYDRYRQQLQERGPRPAEGDEFQWFPIDNPLAFFNFNSPAELRNFDPRSATLYVVDKREDTWYVLAKRGPQHGLLHQRGTGPQWRLKRAYEAFERGRRAVGFELDPVGGRLFARLTGDNVGKQLCIFIDDVAYSAAVINERIYTHGVISGEFSREKLIYLIQTLQAGSLPARLKDTPLSERTFAATLGHTNLRLAFQAGLAGVIVVAVIMAVYYLVAGLIANAALMMNIVLVLAAMSLLGARFTLAGIAGVILTIGMTVDANVLIFERMREEKARGASLRMVIKNGYDKALSTIVDANITTLLICGIIYYVGSEEIKGFGLTLGWGIVCSLFTALFVTRTIFTALVKYNVIKEIRMLQLIGVPKVDWYAKRKFFIPTSLILMVIGLGLLYARGWEAFDVEFRGGISAEVELRPDAAGNYDDVRIRDMLTEVGRQIADEGRRLAEVRVSPVPGDATAFRVEVPGLAPATLAAMIGEPLEDGESGRLLQRGGIETLGASSLVLRVKENVTADKLREAIQRLADLSGDSIPRAGSNIATANVALVSDTGVPAERGRFWNITTTETNKALVQHALVTAFGDDLQTQPRIAYVFRGRDNEPFPIVAKTLERVIPPELLAPGAGADLTDYYGGAAMYFDELSPPQPIEALRERLRSMRLQPDYQDLPWREFDVFGIKPADVDGDGQPDADPDGRPLYGAVVVAVGDPKVLYQDDPDVWLSELARPELKLAMDTLDKEQSLRKLTQFKPQIAAQSQTRALIALLLSWAMIIVYLWIRFGRPGYGLAGVVALIHDVCIALAFVGISGWIGGVNHPIGNALLIHDFKINMTIVAAFLTIIGYSINDTIVVFDRIRETRGRLGVVTPSVINQSINQCLSRTLLTSFTTFVVLLVMYIFGGESIRGFNYCLMIGVITGTYSSIAVASPLLMARFVRQREPQRAAVAAARA